MDKSTLTGWQAAILAMALASGQALAADGFDLAQANGCFVCHQAEIQRVGPTFTDIAKKYAGKKDAVAELATYIVKGTGPNGLGWQAEKKAMLPHMPANVTVTPEDGQILAQWVLTEASKATDKTKFVTDRISVTGRVKQPLELTLDDLQKLPVLQVKMMPHGGNRADGKPPVPVIVKGVLLKDILEKAEFQASSPYDVRKSAILVTASDGYRILFSWPEVFYSPIGEGAILFFEKDGKPLADDEGKIALGSLRDNGNFRYAKWVRTIEVRAISD